MKRICDVMSKPIKRLSRDIVHRDERTHEYWISVENARIFLTTEKLGRVFLYNPVTKVVRCQSTSSATAPIDSTTKMSPRMAPAAFWSFLIAYSSFREPRPRFRSALSSVDSTNSGVHPPRVFTPEAAADFFLSGFGASAAGWKC
jgi:hypothetical protein